MLAPGIARKYTETKEDVYRDAMSGVPGWGEYMGAKVAKGFEGSTASTVLAEARVQAAETEAYGSDSTRKWNEPDPNPWGRREKTYGTEPVYVKQEDWNESHPDFREGIPWQPFMSEVRTRIQAEDFDQRQARKQLIERGSQHFGFWAGSVPGFFAEVVGSLPDPVNLIPFGRAAATAGKGAFKSVKTGMVDGALSNMAADAIVLPDQYRRGEDVDVLGDLAISAVFGAALGGMLGGAGGWLGSRLERRRERLAAAVQEAKAAEAPSAVEMKTQPETPSLGETKPAALTEEAPGLGETRTGEEIQPVQEPKPTEVVEPTGEIRTAEAVEPAGEVRSVEEPRPVETVEEPRLAEPVEPLDPALERNERIDFLRRNVPGEHREPMSRAFAGAVYDFNSGRMVDVADMAGMKEPLGLVYDWVRANPRGGPANTVLATLSCPEFPKAVLELGPALLKDNGELIIRGPKLVEMGYKQAGFGLVKIIWRHGEKSKNNPKYMVTKDDILSVPDIMNQYVPHPTGAKGRDRLWVVDIGDGVSLALVVGKRKGRAEPTVITMYRMEGAGTDGLSKKRESGLLPANPTSFDAPRWTGDTAAGPFTSSPAGAQTPGYSINPANGAVNRATAGNDRELPAYFFAKERPETYPEAPPLPEGEE